MIRALLSLLLLHTCIFPATLAANTVASIKSCYRERETFSFSFTVSVPQVGDKVGILRPAGTHLLISNFTCSQPNCTIASGTVSIRNNLASGQSYRAVLARASQTTLASTGLFRVASRNETCPTPAPIVPSNAPSQSPIANITTSSPTTKIPLNINEAARRALNGARTVLAAMVRATPRLTPQFLRMGFHDCIEICDGCIDLTNPDNFGLENAIAVLDPVVKQFAKNGTGVSRADIWGLAVAVAADVADHGHITRPISFDMNWFGRINCEDANKVCLNAQGATVPCSATVGPRRNMPSTSFNSEQVFSYFAREYNFTERQTVTIMGAHTVGHLLSNESGIDGPKGWTFNNVILQNEYYPALLGGARNDTPDSNLIAASTRWKQAFQNNSGTVFPDKNFWRFSNLVMLNTDLALVRDFNSNNMDPTTGVVNCSFNAITGPPLCPMRSTIRDARDFLDNDRWLAEFKVVLDLMVTNGYNRNNCSSAVCQLTPKSRNSSSLPPTMPPTFPPGPITPPSQAPMTTPVAPSTPKPTATPTAIPGSSKGTTPPVPIDSASAAPIQSSAPSLPPVPLTLKPTNPTAKPITPTLKPITPTLKPISPTLKPTTIKPATKPVTPTVTPKPPTIVAVTKQPTKKPVAPTRRPVTPTLKPLAPTNRPVVPTKRPFSPTKRPVAPTRRPVVPTKKPATVAPAVSTGRPTTKPVTRHARVLSKTGERADFVL